MTNYSQEEACLTPVKAIRTKCLDCTCYQPSEVRLCPSVTCALWPYRMGKRPVYENGQLAVIAENTEENE